MITRKLFPLKRSLATISSNQVKNRFESALYNKIKETYNVSSQELEPIWPKIVSGKYMPLKFTCDADKSICQQKSDAERKVFKPISKHSYEQGVVLVKCPCKKLHLIADNLGWFDDKSINIEDILEEKKQHITKVNLDVDLQIA
eukprot:snap_masked-scaffold_4-processed-gene-10.39-mRNA-1 protein AED:0.16 eAED:0.49 QI:0/-1/0/1/-1/1/1/0/143